MFINAIRFCNALLWLFVISLGASAAIPPLFSYQGLLTDTQGLPLTGPVSLKISLYDAAEDGQLLFSETHDVVQLAQGVFSIHVGGATVGGIPLSALTDPEVYLGISVNNDPELHPRTRLVMVPYAYQSLAAHMLTTPDTANPAVSVSTLGNVGIGTTQPVAQLDLRGRMILGHAFTPTFIHAQNHLNLIIGRESDPNLNGISFYDTAQNPNPIHLGFDALTNPGTSMLNIYNATNQVLMSIEHTGNINFDSDTLVVDAQNNRVGIGTPTPQATLHVAGDLLVDGEILGESQTHYLAGSFASFRPKSIDMNVQIGPFTAQGLTSGQNVEFFAPLYFPDNAVIKKLTVYAIDFDDTQAMVVQLGRITFEAPSFQPIAVIATTKISLSNTSVKPFESEPITERNVVDNQIYNYIIKARLTVPDDVNSLRITGFRIEYTTGDQP